MALQGTLQTAAAMKRACNGLGRVPTVWRFLAKALPVPRRGGLQGLSKPVAPLDHVGGHPARRQQTSETPLGALYGLLHLATSLALLLEPPSLMPFNPLSSSLRIPPLFVISDQAQAFPPLFDNVQEIYIVQRHLQMLDLKLETDTASGESVTEMATTLSVLRHCTSPIRPQACVSLLPPRASSVMGFFLQHQRLLELILGLPGRLCFLVPHLKIKRVPRRIGPQPLGTVVFEEVGAKAKEKLKPEDYPTNSTYDSNLRAFERYRFVACWSTGARATSKCQAPFATLHRPQGIFVEDAEFAPACAGQNISS
ncbi:hypothetical protein GGX14DRAFT_564865 [Mycena pura]|uniref:Uncharacterized protein n=1 Tax=Mycena pura TaxID=153505 RepID=A0AAD6YCI6_9AGAR|nr:hypothetical protein GGX14DRAFT_564865 [Mycena pura]